MHYTTTRGLVCTSPASVPFSYQLVLLSLEVGPLVLDDVDEELVLETGRGHGEVDDRHLRRASHTPDNVSRGQA